MRADSFPSSVPAGMPLDPPTRRVAMIIQRFRPDPSGQGVQLEELCRALGRRGIHGIILSATRGRASDREVCDGYEVRRLRADLLPGSASRSGLWAPTYGARVLAALLALGRVDVVHVHGLHDGLYGAALYCRMRRVPLVFEMTLMGVDDPRTALSTRHWFAGLRHRVYRDADAFVAMSRAFLPAYQAAGLPSDRLHVIPQGVDTGRFRPRPPDERRRIRAELGCPPEAPVVVFLGSLIARKGLDVLLAAWPEVRRDHPDARLVLAGRDEFPEGSAEGRFLDAHLAAVSPDDRTSIRRVGLRDDPERVLAAADVFAFPSRREGFGSVIIEAMACGVPAVVSRLDGITDFIFAHPLQAGMRDGQPDGIVVPQGDAAALSRALRDLLDDPERRAAIGEAGRRRAGRLFDFDHAVAPAYDALYAAVRMRPGQMSGRIAGMRQQR